MPWHIEMQNGKHCVVKDSTNEIVTCHTTAAEAQAHMAALYANEPSAAKAGRKISRANMSRIQQIADHAYAMGAKPPAPDSTPMGKADMSFADRAEALRAAVSMAASSLDAYPYIEDMYDDYIVIEIGGACYRADYSIDTDGAVTLAARSSWVEVEEVWQPVSSAAAKAGLNMDADSTAIPYASIKALADRHLEVKVAYYGHKGGKDSHDEFFDAATDFDPENFPQPPLLYYHGYTEDNQKAAKPIVTGKFISRRNGGDGHYLTYKLKNGKYADLQWDAAEKGTCVVSPGTVGHLIRKAANGHLDYWPLAEVSAWDYSDKRRPANLHSIASPVLKALYLSEGLTLPRSVTANDPKPETPGDGVSAGDPHADVSPDEAARIVTSQIVAALLAKNNMRT